MKCLFIKLKNIITLLKNTLNVGMHNQNWLPILLSWCKSTENHHPFGTKQNQPLMWVGGFVLFVFICHKGARLKFMNEIPLDAEVCFLNGFFVVVVFSLSPLCLLTAVTHLLKWLLPDITWSFYCLFRTRQWNRRTSNSPVMTQFWACAFLMSLWSAAGLIG